MDRVGLEYEAIQAINAYVMIINKLFFILCILVYLTLLGCESRKDPGARVIYEAKVFERRFGEIGTDLDRAQLTEIIRQVEADSPGRWRISEDEGKIIETLSAYMDYRNPSRNTKFIYTINSEGKIELVTAHEKSNKR